MSNESKEGNESNESKEGKEGRVQGGGILARPLSIYGNNHYCLWSDSRFVRGGYIGTVIGEDPNHIRLGELRGEEPGGYPSVVGEI